MNVEAPLVSVVVPVFNVEPYLREALDSVIGQTYANLEVIVVDDGSTDGSREICDEYLADPRVRVVHQRNRGLSAARNTGLDLVTGNVVAFLDSDDAFYPRMVEVLVGEMERSGADVVACDFDWDLKGDGPPRGSYDSAGALRELAAGRMELAVWNKLYRVEVWDGVRFPVGRNYEGTCTTPWLLESASRVEVLPDKLMFHRTRQGSIVQTGSLHNSLDFFAANRELEGFVAERLSGTLSEAERGRFAEWRFNQKVSHWNVVAGIDSQIARGLRREILCQATGTRYWGRRSRLKLVLLMFCPGMFRLALNR